MAAAYPEEVEACDGDKAGDEDDDEERGLRGEKEEAELLGLKQKTLKRKKH